MKVVKWLDKYFEEVVIGILLFVIAFSIIAQVIMRYAFNAAMSWPEEISRYTLVMLCFMTIGYCSIHRSSLKIDTVLMLLPIKVQYSVTIACNVVLILLYAYLAHAGYLVTSDAFANNNVTSALGIPLGYIYSVSLFGLFIAILRLLQVIVQDLKALATGKVEEREKTLEDVL